MSDPIVTAAIDYLDMDLSVIPVLPSKKPAIEWKQFQSRPLPSAEAPRVFKDQWGLAIVCGKGSLGVEMIDFDAHGRDITDVYNKFASDKQAALILDKYPNICVERSMRGGYHVAYRYAASKYDGNQKLANWENGETMIETRGEGGYTVVYPSPGYTLVRASFDDLPTIEDFERDYLLDLCRSFTMEQVVTPSATTTGHDSNPVSYFNWAKAGYAKKLLEEAGWSLQKTDERTKIEYWLRPGKAKGDAHSATWGYKDNTFYVFTSNGKPFDAEKYYTPFDILIKLRFDGDFWKAASWITETYLNEVAPPPPPVIVPQIPTPDQPDIVFPVDVFPPVMQGFINELNGSLNYSRDFLSTAIMFTIATINGNYYKVHVKETWQAPTIFWFAVVGDPGTMKSHPISTITKVIRSIDKRNHASYEADFKHWEIEQGLKKGKPSPGTAPKYKQILINDITIESLHEVHSFNRRGLGFFKDELMGLFNSMNQYHKGGDEQFWLESFNNGDYTVNRVTKRAIQINNVMVNIIGTIQPSVLSKMAKDFSGNGLTDRFLFTGAEHTIFRFNTRDVNPGALKWWNERMENFNQHCRYLDQADTIVLPMSADALKEMEIADDKICTIQESDSTSEAMKAYLNKAKTYMPRFALLMALIDGICDGVAITEVTGDQIQRAYRVMRYFIDSAMSIFAEAAKVSEMTEMIQVKKGNSVQEKIKFLHGKGFKGVEIAKQVGKTPAYVSQVINGRIN